LSGNDWTGEWGTKLTQKSPNLRGSGRIALGVVSVLAVTVTTLLPAEAKRSGEAHHFRAHVVTHDHDYSPPYAAIVVDANSGNVLSAASADELRHPASLTKIMTLYLLFERLEAGKLKLDSQLPVSEHASIQAPTKLGLKPGQTIAVEDAIKGLVTKSANDAAVVVGEAVGGNESDFAEMMTKKAHALGMSHTVYRNASGLPNDEQVTTARDQALLGRAIQERFPSQYRYFSTLSFTYHGEAMRNHNMLLGHVEGVDGIKTGYTQASGFNLVTSVHRNNRHIVAVVLGGASAGSRDAKMRSLIEAHIASASTQHTAIAIAETAGAKAETRTATAKAADTKAEARPAKAPSTYSVASFSPPAAWPASKFVPVAPAQNALTATVRPVAPPAAKVAAVAPVNDAMKAPAVAKPATPVNVNDTIKPIQVKTIRVKLTQTQTAGLGPIVAPVREEHAETVAEPALPPVAAPKAPAHMPVAAAPVAPAPIASPAAAAPVAPSPVAAPKSVAIAPAAVVGPIAAPSVAAVAAPVAHAPMAAPKSVATAPAPVAAPIAAPSVAAVAAPVVPAPMAAPKSVAIAPAPVAAPIAAPSVAAVATPVAPAPVAVPKTVAAAPSAAPTPAMAAAPMVVATARAAPEAIAPEPKRDATSHGAATHTGWIVQVGAFDVERDAQQRLSNAHAKIGHVLDNADPFTEPVMKGDKTLYRARFAGFQQKDEADAVCKQLKRNDIDCMTIRN
jgi:D-alanyl-D-alanine carboxypeptidase